jgi:DNA-3-methyladenine glycosylase I
VTVAADGLERCPWALSAPAYPPYLAYHDDEWGRPVRGERELYERISLEAFQSGLAWITVLRKREAFRSAFAGFDPQVVAEYDEADVDRLMTDAGIIRNRRKIEATVANARAVLDLSGDLTDLLWSFAPDPPPPPPVTVEDVPAVTPESAAMAKALRARGFRFVGPTTAYALMQATGMVDDHLASCAFRGAGQRPSNVGRSLATNDATALR